MSNFVKIYRRDVVNYLASEYRKRYDDRERAVSKLTGILAHYDKDLATKINKESLFFGTRYYWVLDALEECKLNKRHREEVVELERTVADLMIELRLLDEISDKIRRIKDPDKKNN